jgi:hypothetical protein
MDTAMTDVPSSRPAHQSTEHPPVTAWLGWVLFIAIILLSAGLINVTQGLIALFDSDSFAAARSDLIIDVNFAAWGWALLILGTALVVAGAGIALGYGWARAVGVVAAAINAMVNVGFIGAYPAWAVLAVSFDVLAIYALVVHGAEAKAVRTGPR